MQYNYRYTHNSTAQLEYSSKRTSATKANDTNSNNFFLQQQLVIVFTLSVLFGFGWGIGYEWCPYVLYRNNGSTK